MRKIASMVSAALIVLILVTLYPEAAVNARSETVVGYFVPPGQYTLVREGNFDRFTNHVDGYSLLVPSGMTVDMSFSEVGAFLENENIRIELYRQYVGDIGKHVYINYSKFFLYNTLDHYTQYRGSRTIGAHNVAVTSWNRNRLARIPNDKNHYITLEIYRENHVYSIFVKSNAPITQLGGYAYLVESLRFEPRTAPPFVQRTRAQDIEARGWNDETKELFIRFFSPCAPLTWGIFEPTTAMFDYSVLLEYEAFFEYEFPFLLNYSEFENPYRHPNLRQRLDMAHDHGRTLVLTLQTPLHPSPGSNYIYRIMNGQFDDFLADYAQAIADFGHPVMFRLANEMNGDWCYYSAFHTSKDTVIFREFWRYVWGFFERAGANANTIWVWNPNGESLPYFNWNHELMYYPGDRYVDVVGLTKYNTGTFYYYAWGETWQEFYELYDHLYARYTKIYGQPLMIPEFASASMGGDKEQWVINMFEHIQTMPSIKIAIWWDGSDLDAYGNVARSYYIDETPRLMEIFRENLRRIGTDGAFG
ncbi:MAG: glycoside hydrolase family 26 protein [Clostridiales bacterium]|nr:glycoside hydrolase family 26 protein [Clostridiales bacterium]